jgi:hypothetical protein
MWTDANKANDKETNASKADEANDATANLADDGKFKFCPSYSLKSFSLFTFSQSPSQNIVKSLLK